MASDLGIKIRDGHPRLFITEETIDDIVRYAKTEERDAFDRMSERVDRLLDDGIGRGDHGKQSAEAAFLYLATDERQYLELARELLVTSLEHYRECYENESGVGWFSWSRINAWAAFDWILDDLDPGTRQEIGEEFLDLVDCFQPTDERESFSPENGASENWSSPQSGFYGTTSQLWHAGIVAHGEGFNDELADSFLREGYDLNMELLEYRSELAGDDGGSATTSLGYALRAYPWAEFNFFHTMKSATGNAIAKEWPYVARLSGFLFWNWLPGRREFGTGDSYHIDNQLPIDQMDMHLSQIVHLYGDSLEEEVAFAKWLRERTSREFNARDLPFPFARFLVHDRSSDVEPRGPPDDLPFGRHYENMGQTYFRSGSGEDDTYAVFTGGGDVTSHRHYDNNHFGIYKKGFQALDTGTRPQPGNHNSHYFGQTVAHNSVLIHMPGEEMPGHWGNPAEEESDVPIPNDGGQREYTGSEVTAFDTGDCYSYIACDATEAYHPEKCALAFRQFIFLPPDTFVVMDRVNSTLPEYAKTWLLHTATEPTIEGDVFAGRHEGGRLFGRTVLPGDAEISKVGGPGNQFRAGGENWPIPEPEKTHIDVTNENPFFGQWRVEVTPGEERKRDHFLHLLRVNDRQAGDLPGPTFSPPKRPKQMRKLTDPQNMVDAEPLERTDQVGLRFVADGKHHEILFGTDGEPSGSIRIEADGSVIVDEQLTDDVEPQSGLFG